MKRLESNLLNMVLSLTVVTLVAAAVLGGLYVLTEKPIAEQKAAKQQNAIISVLPQAEGIEVADAENVNGITIYRAFVGEELVGAAVETEENGFGGKFHIMVGFDAEGNVVNYEVLDHQETPGLGDHMTDWFKTEKNNQSIIGKTPAEEFVVSKDGGQVDAITAATISSRAFLKAVNAAYAAYTNQSVDAETGASALSEKEELKEVCGDSLQIETEMLNEEIVESHE